MKSIFTFLCIGFVSTYAFCQEQYFKSTIIDKDGNKIEGYISNLFDSKSIKFKSAPKSNPINYSPTQIKGFILAGNVYESKKVSFRHYKYASSFLGVTGDAPAVLTVDEERGITIDNVFVQKIIAGNVNLYKMRHTDNAQYLFAEKNNILHEIPRQYVTSDVNKNAKNDVQSMAVRKGSTLNYVTYEYKTYLDTLAMVCNDSSFVQRMKPFNYSEKKIVATVGAYNRMKGVPNGGLLKQSMPRQFFYGGSIGKIAWKRDERFKYESTEYSVAAKGYILMPLTGINRNVFAKGGVNYFVYGNRTRSMTVLSASAGLRLASISGPIRPYGELSLAISEQFVNNEPSSTLVPTILELGVVIPVKNVYVTVGSNFSPFKYTPQNGYQIMAWHVGLMF